MNAAGPEQPGKGAAPAAGAPESQALEQEIQQTREQLGDTVAELAAKADVKARTKDKAQQLTGQLKAAARQEPVLLAVAGGAMAVGIGLIVWGIRQ